MIVKNKKHERPATAEHDHVVVSIEAPLIVDQWWVILQIRLFQITISNISMCDSDMK